VEFASNIIRGVSVCRSLGDRLKGRAPAARRVAEGRAAFYRAVWADAAKLEGASVAVLDSRLLEIRRGGLRLRIRDNCTSLDDPLTLDVAGDKALVHRLLGAAGVPVPRHKVCRATDIASALAFVTAACTPCVVKPARSTAGGAGVTSGVNDWSSLLMALGRAAAYCRDVVLEEQVPGSEYRLLYLDGRLLDAVRRGPPTVSGDGRSTVRRLIARENRRRLARGIQESQAMLHLDADLRATLAAAGCTLGSVLPAGQVLAVKTVVSENSGEDNTSALGAICPAVVEAASRAAAAVGVRLAGVDLITADPGVSLEQSGGAVIEVNTTPSLYCHYAKRPGPTPVARLVLHELTADER